MRQIKKINYQLRCYFYLLRARNSGTSLFQQFDQSYDTNTLNRVRKQIQITRKIERQLKTKIIQKFSASRQLHRSRDPICRLYINRYIQLCKASIENYKAFLLYIKKPTYRFKKNKSMEKIIAQERCKLYYRLLTNRHTTFLIETATLYIVLYQLCHSLAHVHHSIYMLYALVILLALLYFLIRSRMINIIFKWILIDETH